MHKGCKYFVWPKNNAEFWENKIEKTVARDATEYEQLRLSGWRVLIVWECELRAGMKEATLKALVDNLATTVVCDKVGTLYNYRK